MTDYNKETLAQTIVYLVVGLVVFFSLVAFVQLVRTGNWWATPVPAIAIGYGIYAFIKKYYPKKDNK